MGDVMADQARGVKAAIAAHRTPRQSRAND
jgi:hypothetical protein